MLQRAERAEEKKIDAIEQYPDAAAYASITTFTTQLFSNYNGINNSLDHNIQTDMIFLDF